MKKSALTLALGLVLGASVFTVAHATDGTIRACVSAQTSVARIVDRDCYSKERMVEWNASAPPAPAGTVVGLHRIYDEIYDPDLSSGGSYYGRCPVGEVAISGSAFYGPGTDLPWVSLAVEMIDDRPPRADGLGRDMGILFGFYPIEEGRIGALTWTMVCGIVV